MERAPKRAKSVDSESGTRYVVVVTIVRARVFESHALMFYLDVDYILVLKVRCTITERYAPRTEHTGII